MPLLMCPNDNAAMQTLERSGVQFDMCPTCRGVWLDRGELEKLMESAVQEGAASVPPAPPQGVPPQPWGQQRPDAYRQDGHRPDDYRKDKYRRDDDDFYRRRKKRDSIFDIFD